MILLVIMSIVFQALTLIMMLYVGFKLSETHEKSGLGVCAFLIVNTILSLVTIILLYSGF